MKKSVLTILLAGSLLAGTGGTALAEQTAVSTEVYFVPVDFVFDDAQLTPPEGQNAFIYQGSTYVPLRFVSYALSKSVQWEGSSYTVALSEPDQAEKISIEEYKLNRKGKPAKTRPAQIVPSTIKTYFENITYVFDGKQVQPPQQLPGFIYQDVLYVPLRFVSESLGKDIGWNQDTYTVSVKTTAPVEPKAKEPIAKPKEEPKTAPVQPVQGGPVIPGGGGGVIPSKPSYDSLIGDAESKMKNLEASAESSFTSLYNQYSAATNETTKLSLIAQGSAALKQYDSNFKAIMDDLESKLSTNGYSTEIINTYKTQYESKKATVLSGIK